eukprot:TRINITY_DN1621_c0_g3_i1.p1 TRINITY_DN1621_c0_g3~~TRINITY_DN1621_c0_g3_i1.p1  ORF type:complete len:585 (+),score=21.71 TRINITY_DN1621_c0_g3_i1:657-2411(+)
MARWTDKDREQKYGASHRLKSGDTSSSMSQMRVLSPVMAVILLMLLVCSQLRGSAASDEVSSATEQLAQDGSLEPVTKNSARNGPAPLDLKGLLSWGPRSCSTDPDCSGHSPTPPPASLSERGRVGAFLLWLFPSRTQPPSPPPAKKRPASRMNDKDPDLYLIEEWDPKTEIVTYFSRLPAENSGLGSLLQVVQSQQQDSSAGQNDKGQDGESVQAVPISSENPSQTLRLYESYGSEQLLPITEVFPSEGDQSRTSDSDAGASPFRGLCLSPNSTLGNSLDIDAAALLPALQDPDYRHLLCEAGAIFSVDSNLDLQGTAAWAGFQSRRARTKERMDGLLDPAALQLVVHMREMEAEHVRSQNLAQDDENWRETMLRNRGLNMFYYWAPSASGDFLGECRRRHKQCHHVFSVTFSHLLAGSGPLDHSVKGKGSVTLREFIPSIANMPDGKGYAECTHWAMHESYFRRFASFARAFFVTLEDLWPLRGGNFNKCPLSFKRDRAKRSCWCVLVERIVNIWALHNNMRMMLVDRETGQVEEQFVGYNGTNRNLGRWFRKDTMQELLERFPSRLQGESLKLYRDLGGKS